MKHLRGLGLLLFAMFLSVAFISCSDDDDDPVVENKNEIVAAWKLSTVTQENPNDTISALALLPVVAPCYNQLILTFAANNKITPSGCEQLIALMAQTGYLTLGTETTWQTDADNLIITNGSNNQSFKYSISGTDLKIIVDTDLTTTSTKNIVLLLKKQ